MMVGKNKIVKRQVLGVFSMNSGCTQLFHPQLFQLLHLVDCKKNCSNSRQFKTTTRWEGFCFVELNFSTASLYNTKEMHMSFTSFWASIPLVLIGLIITILILQWLWNTTMPDVFGLKKVTYFQTLKILIISMILTGGGSSLFSTSTTETKVLENITTTYTLKFGLP